MNQFEDDEALARLRAADPAKGAHPDLHRISQRLRGRTPLGGDSTDGDGTGGDSLSSTGTGSPEGFSFSGSNDLAVHVKDPGVRTGRGGLLVAAAVAALALGGGGYALGVNTGDDTPQASPSTSTRDSGEGAEGFADSPGMSSQTESSAVRESGEAMADSGDGDSGGGYGGPVVPVAGEGLSTERTTGPVYAAGAQTDDAAELLGEYADRLGIEGEVQDDGYSAYVVSSTGNPISLNSYSQGGITSLDYSDISADPACESYRQEWIDSGDDGSWFGPGVASPDDMVCQIVDASVSDETAVATVRDFLTKAGVDPADLEVTVDAENMGFSSGMEGSSETAAATFVGEMPGDSATLTQAPSTDEATVTDETPEVIDPAQSLEAVKGVQVTQGDSPLSDYRSWHFTVSSGGVIYGSLQLGELVEMGDYPVISPVEAVERSNDERFSQMGAYIPNLDYGMGYSSDSMEEWTEPTPLPAMSPGDLIPYPVGQSAVTKAELHTGVISMWDGTEFVVPVYDLSDGDGNHWQVFAVAEDSLDFTP